MTDDQKLDLLKHEYLKLQDFYEDFDKRIHGIKGWSVTVALAAIAGGLHYKNEFLGLFAAAAALIFWGIEGTWKAFQYHHKKRIEEIEEMMRLDDLNSVTPLQMYSSWYESFGRKEVTFKLMVFLPIVFIPHLPIFALGVFFFVTQHFNIIQYWP